MPDTLPEPALLAAGGDCAETFADCNEHAIQSKLKVLIQMNLVLTYGARTPLVRILRGAGQVGTRVVQHLLGGCMTC